MHANLYVERREHHLKQKDVAEIMIINPITYHRKETGKTDSTLTEATKRNITVYFNLLCFFASNVKIKKKHHPIKDGAHR